MVKCGDGMANTIKTEAGAEIYETRIHELADEYINNLDDPESINNNPSLFTGMIKYIYKYLFKNNPINNDDIDILDNVFDIYTELCYRYNKRPTLLNFSLLVGVSNDTFNAWKNGEYRAGADGASSAHSLTVKKWLAECESSLVDGATERNSVGCIFALKANYGYTEAPQRIEVVGGQLPDQAAADIAARHRIGQAERPEVPPELFDN